MYIYIYIHIHICLCTILRVYFATSLPPLRSCVSRPTYLNWVALLVERYLSNTASFVLCVLCRVRDGRTLLHDSPSLKNACVRQVVLDEWFHPTEGATEDSSST